jgi:hypothetical protein
MDRKPIKVVATKTRNVTDLETKVKKKATRNWLNNIGHGIQSCGT